MSFIPFKPTRKFFVNTVREHLTMNRINFFEGASISPYKTSPNYLEIQSTLSEEEEALLAHIAPYDVHFIAVSDSPDYPTILIYVNGSKDIAPYEEDLKKFQDSCLASKLKFECRVLDIAEFMTTKTKEEARDKVITEICDKLNSVLYTIFDVKRFTSYQR